jgi:hypothetical protein
LTAARGVPTVRIRINRASKRMPTFVLARYAVVALALLLAGCGGGEAPHYDPLRYDYLTKLKLNVGRVDIDDTWTPRGGDRHVEFLAPTPPLDALRHMAEDRLVPGGTAGSAQFTILDASIVRRGGSYRASLAVRLDILDDKGERQRGIEAHGADTHPVSDDDAESVRADLYALTRKAMDDMNVDFEFQIRHTLGSDLQTTSPTAPAPPSVDTQDLDAPGAQPPPQ